jgi:hypothetical protein
MSPENRSIAHAIVKFAAANALACLLLAPTSRAAVTILFQQVGDDTVVTSTGDLDFTGLSWSWSGWELEDGAYRQIGGNLPQDLMRMYRTSVSSYEFERGADFFSGNVPFQIADAFSGMTFGIWANSTEMAVYVPRNFRSGTIESSVTFRNLSLASLGVIDQVIDLGNSEGQRIIISSVPEPGMISLSALALVGAFARRRR